MKPQKISDEELSSFLKDNAKVTCVVLITYWCVMQKFSRIVDLFSHIRKIKNVEEPLLRNMYHAVPISTITDRLKVINIKL